MARFSLKVTFSSGFTTILSETYARQFEADRAAQNYIRDWSNPCGIPNERVLYVSVLDRELLAA